MKFHCVRFLFILSIFLLLTACGVLEVRLETPTSAQETTAPKVTPEALRSDSTPTSPVTLRPALSPTPGEIPVNFGPDVVDLLTAEINPSLAASTSVESLAAEVASPGGPYWQGLPRRVQLTFTGYPITNTAFQPQITIFPVEEFRSVNETAGKVIDSLNALLALKPGELDLDQASMTLPPGQSLPFLPLQEAQQIFHTRMSYFTFKNGQGVCYLTQFSQDYGPVSNRQLIYTCQGLTSNGRFYAAAALPVNLAFLPLEDTLPTEIDPGTYFIGISQQLNSEAPASFTPDLSKLDAMLASLMIR